MFLRAVLSLCIVVALLCLLAPQVLTSLPGSASSTAVDVAIRGVLTKQQTAWNQGDVTAFMTGYWNSTELSFAGSEEITRGWDTVRALIAACTRTRLLWVTWIFLSSKSGLLEGRPRSFLAGGT